MSAVPAQTAPILFSGRRPVLSRLDRVGPDQRRSVPFVFRADDPAKSGKEIEKTRKKGKRERDAGISDHSAFGCVSFPSGD